MTKVKIGSVSMPTIDWSELDLETVLQRAVEEKGNLGRYNLGKSAQVRVLILARIAAMAHTKGIGRSEAESILTYETNKESLLKAIFVQEDAGKHTYSRPWVKAIRAEWLIIHQWVTEGCTPQLPPPHTD